MGRLLIFPLVTLLTLLSLFTSSRVCAWSYPFTLTDVSAPVDVSATVTAACLGDYNHDGWVNLTDFSILLYYWGKHNPAHDLSGDGYVNLTDFSITLFHWGKCP